MKVQTYIKKMFFMPVEYKFDFFIEERKKKGKMRAKKSPFG